MKWRRGDTCLSPDLFGGSALAYRFGIFTCDNSRRLGWAVKSLKTYQRKQVARLRIVCKYDYSWSWLSDASFAYHGANLQELFPALELVKVSFSELRLPLHDGMVEKLHLQLHETIQETGCKLLVAETVEQVDYRFMGWD